MDNPENANISNVNDAQPHNPQPPIVSDPGAGIELPAQKSGKQPRNQHLKVAEPKDKQLGGRATQTEFDLIQRAMKANGCTDIVRLMLFSINLHQKDILTPFKL
jgi:hypothetical protein